MLEVRLPQWGMGMDEGTVLSWTKAVGDHVDEGETLAVIDTAKVETELESPSSGTLHEILVQEQQTVPVGTLLALIDDN